MKLKSIFTKPRFIHEKNAKHIFIISFIAVIIFTALTQQVKHDITVKDYKQIISEKNSTIDALQARNEIVADIPLRIEDMNLSTKTLFHIASDYYGINFKMLYAIAILETGNFTSGLWLNSNNPGGMRASEDGWLVFDTPYEGVMAMAKLLKVYYIDRGRTTLEQIGEVYCPNTASDWAYKVARIEQEITD